MLRQLLPLIATLITITAQGQGSFGAGNDEIPQIGTPLGPTGPSGGGAPETLFPSIDTNHLDNRPDDIGTRQSQELDLPSTETSIGTDTGLGTSTTPIEEEL